MNKKWLIGGVIIVLLAVIAGAVILHVWFESDGVHVLGSDIHAELSGKCYIINSKTNEVLDETSLYINGSGSYSDSTIFEGSLSVVGYQNTADGKIESTMAVEQGEKGYWKIHCIETCTHQETVDGNTKPKEHFCKYEYVYYLNPDYDDRAFVRIEATGEDAMYAVYASSEEQALQLFQEFYQ